MEKYGTYIGGKDMEPEPSTLNFYFQISFPDLFENGHCSVNKW